MTTSAASLDLLTLLRLPGIGPRAAVRRVEGDAGSATDVPGFDAAREDAERLVRECASLAIGIVGWFDDEFPDRLKNIPKAPAILFYKGDLSVASELRSVAIVGTRKPTDWGRSTSHRIAETFASDGWVVVSGLALGVDTIAHEEALRAGARTIAVLGNGLATVYPSANRGLAQLIVENSGLLLAEAFPREEAEARSLVRRDRLQSGLAAITVVTQAGRGSGAMHTARFAAEQGRALYCAALDRRGAEVGPEDEGIVALLNESADRLPDVLPAWRSASRRVTASSRPVAQPLDEAALAGALDGLLAAGDAAGSDTTLF